MTETSCGGRGTNQSASAGWEGKETRGAKTDDGLDRVNGHPSLSCILVTVLILSGGVLWRMERLVKNSSEVSRGGTSATNQDADADLAVRVDWERGK